MIKAVLFDLDGTLVNTLEDLADSVNYALAKFGFPTHETEKFKYFVGNGMQNLIERSLPEKNRDEETRKKVLGVFSDFYKVHFADKTIAYDGIEDVINKLKEQGLKIAIVSNKVQEMTSKVVDVNFSDAFDIVCGNREGYPHKPDPTLTLEIISELGVSPQECVFIGDSGMDALNAVNAGCIGIGVLWGFRDEKELRDCGAHYIAKKPSDILNILKEIGNGI